MCLGITGVIAGIGDDAGVPVALVATETGTRVSACLLTCPDAAVGDTVLIHAGYVLRCLATHAARDVRTSVRATAPLRPYRQGPSRDGVEL
jgi:hydrogenase maturation factor